MANYISLKEAAKYCAYSQDYLKLRARQGKLKAIKMARNWVTTREWVEEYQEKFSISPRPSAEGRGSIKRKRNFEQEIRPSRLKNFLFICLTLILISVGVFLLLSFSRPILEKIIPAKIIEIEREIN